MDQWTFQGGTSPRVLASALLALSAAACGTGDGLSAPEPSSDGAPAPPRAFPDQAGELGLDYANVSGSPRKPTLLEANGAGCALFDLGADGDLDAAFGQGVESIAAFAAGEGASLALYENQGGGRFRATASPAKRAWWTGLAAGDIDGDGRSDLVAGGFGALDVLLQHPEEARMGQAQAVAADAKDEDGVALWHTSLALFDADGDGFLDLFAGRYVAFDPEAPPLVELNGGSDETSGLGLPCWWKGLDVFCGPRGMQAQPDALFRGEGDGSFRERSAEWLRETKPGYTLGVAAFDADLDGTTDLYVAIDSEPNRLHVNRLETLGFFEELGFAAGVAVNPDGASEAGMGIAVGDVNQDGLFDLAVTNFSDEPTQLYLGARIGFGCATYRSGLAHVTRPYLSWGAHLVDFTGDGRLELYTANGHVYPQADTERTNTSYAQVDSLFAFDGDGDARALAVQGAIFETPSGSRGSAVGDVDGDGAPDLLITRIDGPCALGINRLDPGAKRLELRLTGSGTPGPAGRKTPRDAMGTRVILRRASAGIATAPLVQEVHTSRGFQSASSPFLSFGLGVDERLEGLTILWASGLREEIPGGAANRRLWITEARGIVREETF